MASSSFEDSDDILDNEASETEVDSVRSKRKRTSMMNSSSPLSKESKNMISRSESKTRHMLNHGRIIGGKPMVTQDVFRRSVNVMILMGGLPLSFIDGLGFRRFCSKVFPSYEIHSQETVLRDIFEMYTKEKEVLKGFFSATKPRVSLTTTIWTDTSRTSFLVITVHFIDASWHLKKRIIGFKHITNYEGSSIANVVLDCLDDWGIEKIFTITADSISSSALMRLRNMLKLRGNGVLVQDGEFMHISCCAHILRSIVKDSLQEVDSSVAAIRNAVKYVKSSYPRLKSFESHVDTGKITRGRLYLDCTIWWESTYFMLMKALKFRLAFDKMLAEDKFYNDYFQEKDDGRQRDNNLGSEDIYDEKKRIGPPTSEDWDNVQRLVKFLKMFYQSPLLVSKTNHVRSSICYSEICTIETNLISLSNNPDTMIRAKAHDMRTKFGKYLDGLGKIKQLLIVASVFDPRKKMCFASFCFEKLYGKDTAEYVELKESIIDLMRRLFEEYNATLNKVGTSSQVRTTSSESEFSAHVDGLESSDAFDLLDDDGYESLESIYFKMVAEKGIEDINKELDIYLMEKVEITENNQLGINFDILSWWRINSTKFPVLSEIARDILAMQVSVLWTSNTSDGNLDPHKSSSNHYTIEPLVCMEQWLRSDACSDEIVNIPHTMEDAEFYDSVAQEYENAMDGRQKSFIYVYV